MLIIKKIVLSAIIVATSLVSHSYGSTLNPELNESTLEQSPRAELERLKSYIKANKKNKKLLQPFIYALEAEIAIEKNHKKTAKTKLAKALNDIDGILGRKLLKMLVENEASRYKLTKKQDDKLIKHMMDLHKTHKFEIFSEMKPYNSKKVRKLLSRHVPNLVRPSTETSFVEDYIPPSKQEMREDPMFDDIAPDYCRASGNMSKETRSKWRSWTKSLGDVAGKYWEARLDQCAGRGQKAINKYLELIAKHKDSDEYWTYALWAAKRTVIWQRRNSQRKQASINYKTVADLWLDNSAKAEYFGLTEAELFREKANDLLWAARYRALIGEYEEAERYSAEALVVSEKGLAAIDSSTRRKTKKDLTEYRVEGFQTPASRVFVEKGDFEEARRLILKAKEEKSPSKVWDDRLSWYDGFYAYLSSDYELATKGFTELETTTEEHSTKARALFWKARSLSKLGKTTEANEIIATIAKDHPLSYYSVVAAPLMFKDAVDWKDTFPSPELLRKRLENPDIFNLRGLRYVEDGISLAKESHALIEAKVTRYAHDIAFDLYNRSKKKISLLKTPELFVYLSRMLYASGNYFWAIVVSNQLQESDPEFWKKWPEQILVFFPTPHINDYTRVSNNVKMPKTLLYSISRQESAFNSQAVSPANAFGLMQLIIPTARNMAARTGMKTKNLRKTLLTPSENITLGGAYLKELGARYENVGPFVYAAYNAGEGAVDKWLKRRDISDRLAWIEAIPYGETRGYVKNVARNMAIYSYLLAPQSAARKNLSTSRVRRAVVKGLQKRTFTR